MGNLCAVSGKNSAPPGHVLSGPLLRQSSEILQTLGVCAGLRLRQLSPGSSTLSLSHAALKAEVKGAARSRSTNALVLVARVR